jgi:hypothetical protein
METLLLINKIQEMTAGVLSIIIFLIFFGLTGFLLYIDNRKIKKLKEDEK